MESIWFSLGSSIRIKSWGGHAVSPFSVTLSRSGREEQGGAEEQAMTFHSCDS